MSEHGYLLGNERSEAGARFEGISTIFDGWTLRHLRDVGVAQGARVWEVGAGGPSVVRWLGEQVGASGRVVATDVDVRADGFFPLTDRASSGLEAATVLHVRDRLVRAGLVRDEDIARHLTNLANHAHALDLTTAPLISARGTKPSQMPTS